MKMVYLWCSTATVVLANVLFAADPPLKPTDSTIVAVTVYQSTALVTREVTVPAGQGVQEIMITPMPSQILPSSIYAEGNQDTRILSARFRSRAVFQDTREEVRKLESQLAELQTNNAKLLGELEEIKMFLALLSKMETFSTATMLQLTEKGALKSEEIITLANYINENRSKKLKEQVTVQQKVDELKKEIQFVQRQLSEKSGGFSRTERDAVIILEKKNNAAGKVRLSYLVEGVSWRPQYKFRAGKDKEVVLVEYLAGVQQNSGEDWNNVDVTLSTAQPMLNAAPPDLLALNLQVTSHQIVVNNFGKDGKPTSPGFNLPGGPSPQPNLPPGAYRELLDQQSRTFRQQSVDNYNKRDEKKAGELANSAAAVEQFRDLVAGQEEVKKQLEGAVGTSDEGPSVTYHLDRKLSIPSRNDALVVEITRLELMPEYFYKAVPVLTQNVYRLANLVNKSEIVLLAGDATMYQGSDFVGQSQLPLIAIGKPFTVGFGVDPQLQVTRKLMNKTQTTQGGNQVLTFDYQILLQSYKTAPVTLQVWDRLPKAESSSIAVTMVSQTPALSKDAIYERDDRSRNLLRWDIVVNPENHGDKPVLVDYSYKLEFDKNVNLGSTIGK
ncbi:MAG: mucoidy inhibitor MuiA family protein [Zavarzinella sp.]